MNSITSIRAPGASDTEIIARVNSSAYPFTATDLSQMKKFVSTQQVDKPTPFSKEKTGLKRSILIVPGAGAYILCKGKGTDETPGGIPLGANNRATIAIHIETGEKKIFRSGLTNAESSRMEETIINLVNQLGMKHVLGGIAIHYTGRVPEAVETERQDKGGRTLNRSELIQTGRGIYAKTAYLMPYCEKGELYNDDSKGEQMLRYISDVALGIKECHDIGIAHCDIKPENIFLKGEGAYLGDLDRSGFRRTLNQNPPIPSSAGFVPPEFLQLIDREGKPFPEDYDVFAIDLWQLGAVIADKFYGSSFVLMMIQQEKNQKVDLKEIEETVKQLTQSNQNVPPVVPKMVSKLLSIDPKARGTIDEIVTMLKEHQPII